MTATAGEMIIAETAVIGERIAGSEKNAAITALAMMTTAIGSATTIIATTDNCGGEADRR
ncbi:MAG: hypothetical protein J2P31_02320 [Blastocatellia bacterium]|nr:hypothetical protein [Blastocatellia bacterium]